MRILIAGLGNIFAGDDGFGCAVAAALAETSVETSAKASAKTSPKTFLPGGTVVRDFGIRGVHLAYELLDRYDLVVIVDAVSRGGVPGTCYVIEHTGDPERPAPDDAAPLLDAHDMTPDEVLALVPTLGGSLPRVVIVGCEPESIEPGMGLSAPVASSVATAVTLVSGIVHRGFAEADAEGLAALGAARTGGG